MFLSESDCKSVGKIGRIMKKYYIIITPFFPHSDSFRERLYTIKYVLSQRIAAMKWWYLKVNP